jgi:hypothetical protein
LDPVLAFFASGRLALEVVAGRRAGWHPGHILIFFVPSCLRGERLLEGP